jgi:thiamine kinase-like enzyme
MPFSKTTQNSVALASQVNAMLRANRWVSDDALMRCTYSATAAWLGSGALERHVLPHEDVVLGQGDCNLANFLWDGARIRIVDFEDSGPSDRAFELAILVEHISAWSDASLEAEPFLSRFDLTRLEADRLREFRRLAAAFWLLRLLLDAPANRRNPPGTSQRQANRLLALLG